MGRQDGIKLGIVLDRVNLPAEHIDSQETVVSSSSGQQELLALEDGDPSMDLLEKDVQKEVQKEVELHVDKANTIRRRLKRSLQFSSSCLPAPNPIFQKILKQAENEGCDKKDTTVAKEATLSSEELLLNAMNFVPEQVGKKSKNGDKQQQPKAKSKPGKKSKPVPKKSMKKQKKKSQTLKKRPAAKTAKPCKSNPKKEKKEKDVLEVAESSTPPLNYQDYKVEEYPRQSDIYRNTYTSRHYHKARTMAKKAGFSDQEAKERGKKAIQEASKLWEETHPNWEQLGTLQIAWKKANLFWATRIGRKPRVQSGSSRKGWQNKLLLKSGILVWLTCEVLFHLIYLRYLNFLSHSWVLLEPAEVAELLVTLLGFTWDTWGRWTTCDIVGFYLSYLR